ncbi:hypothetical protein NYE24_11960 [Paenibacillus sp. FSL H7-0350]|uniref:hypothetical protein n=1 Tax=unclassified Paenibacillus TaxID=185978 RepID=UPI0003E1CCCC|nr:hypothetical protein [Paenibacillus sp. FSL R7-269]ETT56296.1 hypothetical protein C162_01314 [Paenibacillus sp. FSL R7-269]
MKTRQEHEQVKVMSGEKDWYKQAGRSPLAEPGFTPQLMARIEEAAHESSNRTSGRRRFSRMAAFGGLAAILLLGALVWPFGPGAGLDPAGSLAAVFKPGSGAAVVTPSVSPSASPQGLGLYEISAEFELGGLKYYMPLPLDRNKAAAMAVETSAGIVWSPPPPMVDYLKPKYTHNTEPYTLYLTPKGHPELSKDSAQRLYVFPLYAGGAQSYLSLGGLIGAGDYLLFFSGSYTIGENQKRSGAKLYVMDVRQAGKGKIPVPRELLVSDEAYQVYKSFMAVNPEKAELLVVYYTDDGRGGYTQHNKLYDIATGSAQVLSAEITTENVERPSRLHYGELTLDSKDLVTIVHYEVNGEQRSTKVDMKTGEQWFYDWWYEEYGVKIDASSIEK